MEKYVFNKVVNAERLEKEIKESSITIALDHITTIGEDVEVYFKAGLDEGNYGILYTIINLHVPTPLAQVKPPVEVIGQMEKNDKVLKLCSDEASFDAETGEAVVEIKIPGEFNGVDPSSNGRFVAGGYAFTDAYKFGDRCIAIEVVDKDGIIAPAGTVVKTYHDNEVDESCKGWRMYAAQQGQGEIEIDPIGGYGFVPSGLYLRVRFKKAEGSTATKVAVDVWWGKME